jgi:RND family efflux transporter MFP subunit
MMIKWMVFGLFALGLPAAQAAEVAAVLQWVQRVELSTPVSGVVQRVSVQPGQSVKQGQELLALDSRVYRAKVAESAAAVERLKAEAAEAKRNLDRVQELYNRTVISTTELDQAKLRDARSRAMLAEGEARLRLDESRLEEAVLRAPFDAVILTRNAEPGQAVAAGLQPQALLVVAKSGEMQAQAKLDASQLGKVRPGQAVTVSVAGKTYPGRIKGVGMEPVAATEGTFYPLDVVFPVREPLRAGMAATLKLP